MRLRPFILPIFLICFFAAAAQTASGATPSIVVSSSAAPGETLRVELDRVTPGASVEVVWNKKVYRCYSIGPDSVRALIGIPLATKPGAYTLQFRPRKGAPTVSVPGTSTMTVSVRDYPIDDVHFPDDKTRIFNEALERKEGAKIHQVLLQSRAEQLWEGVFDPPVGGPIEGVFGTHRIRNGKIDAGFHKGVDLRAAANTPAKAASSGVVVLAHPFKIHGKTVIIDHGQGVMSLYLHLKSFSVHPGQAVRKGETIGRVGSTGLSTAPHIHWGVYVQGVPVDPQQWIQTEF